MEKPFQYKLSPESLEKQFRSSREGNERKQLLRIFGMAAVLIIVFIALEGPIFTDFKAHNIGIAARGAGLIATLAGIWRLQRSYYHDKDERFLFGCALVVILHLLVSNFVYPQDLSSIAAWDIAAIFAIYSLTPIGIHLQATLALILSGGSQVLWILFAVPQLGSVEAFATPIAYLAANCFGITLSLTLNRIQRKEFQLLTSERSLRSDLERTMEKLETTLNSRDQLFSVIAHDLRGPIGALSSIGKLLDSSSPISEPERDKLINLLCIGSKTSYELLDNLLDWALSETGSLEPEIAPLDVQKAILQNIDLLSASASNKNIRLTNENGQRLAIQADRKMLNTVIRNLLANAIKFTPKGGEIKLAQKRGENATALITIEDNGIGIEQSRLDHLFHLDFDDTSQGTDGEHGSNLGLRLCQDFTKKQGGTISVESELGKGTRFTLTFPLAPV